MPDYNKLKKTLTEMVQKKKEEKDKEDEMHRMKNEQDRNAMLGTLSGDLVKSLKPVLAEMAKGSRISSDELRSALQEQLNIAIPEIRIPDFPAIPPITVPKPEVTVNVPPIRVPDVIMPKEMDIKGWIGMMGYDKGFLSDPFPVQLRDKDGKPVDLGDFRVAMTGGGGKADFFTIKGFVQSAFSEITNADGQVKVAGTFTAGAAASSFVILGNTEQLPYNSDNPLPITGSITTSPAPQVSGYADSVNVMQYGGAAVPTGLNETNAGVFRTVQMTDSVSSSNIVSSITLKTTQVSGAISSVFLTGYADSSVVYQARTTNPTAKSDGSDVRPSTDDLGRTLTRPVQVRDLIATAYVSVANGTETTLLAGGGAGVFHDLIFVEFSNNSSVAVGVDLRSVTAGNIEKHYEVPANGTAGGALPVPWPQGNVNNNWTVDLPDITGTTVTVSGLFSKEI